MRIVHLSHTDAGAGAGRAAYRIHRSLIGLGQDSHMFVGSKRTNDPTVIPVAASPLGRLEAKVSEYVDVKTAKRMTAPNTGLFSLARFGHFDPSADSRITSADVICNYWLGGGFIRPEAFASIRKPIVWRLSDVWPFTGGCHYPANCERYMVGCGQCPQLTASAPHDASKQLMERKLEAWRDVQLTIAAPSTWMADLARKSTLFGGRRIEVIPTGVDTDTYRPLDRAEARAHWKIPQDKIVIMFGAMDAADPRKGFAQLQGALQIIANTSHKNNLLAVIFGQANVSAADIPIASQFLGRLQDDASLVAAYSAADIVVVPSLEDNLPNVGLEAIACGAPVVGFNVCGMKDIVQHGSNGALADKVDAASLATVLIEMLESDQLLQMSTKARIHAEARFSLTKQAQSYLELYQELAAN